MITRFRVQNYKCLRNVTIDLTPIHVLIGPNDSGKSSILEAIAALCRSVDHELPSAFTGSWDGTSLVWRTSHDVVVELSATLRDAETLFDYELGCIFSTSGRHVVVRLERRRRAGESNWVEFGRSGSMETTAYRSSRKGNPQTTQERNALAGVQYFRWNPRVLALPVALDPSRRFRLEQSGFGLALVLDDFKSEQSERFAELERQFTRTFPQIRSIILKREHAYTAPTDDVEPVPVLQRAPGKGLYFKTVTGFELPASHASDGMLLVLAYLTVLHLPELPRVLLIEEPENGIHPKRLEEVINILRELIKEQSHTQVILTTHSPYLVDLFDPSEVTLCLRQDDGSVAVRRLSESKEVQEQMDIFTLGEIWTAKGDEGLAEPVSPSETPAT